LNTGKSIGTFALSTSICVPFDGKIYFSFEIPLRLRTLSDHTPVALITIAGNYLALLKDVTGVCDDLKFNFGYIGSPSLKIKSLMVSGK
jgi:hypothetical protein